MADQESDTDTRHVEPVEPVLDVEIDVPCVLGPLPLEHALGDCGHGRVVALLDGLERLGEGAVVLANFGWPLFDVRGVGIVPAGTTC